MRRAGNPWQLLVAVLVAGVVANAVGSTAFKVLIWVVFALYVLVQTAPYIAAIGGWIDRLPWGRPQGDKEYFNDIDNPYWQAYMAIRRNDLASLRTLVERDGVDPFAHLPSGIAERFDGNTLSDCARESSFDEATQYFQRWHAERIASQSNVPPSQH